MTGENQFRELGEICVCPGPLLFSDAARSISMCTFKLLSAACDDLL